MVGSYRVYFRSSAGGIQGRDDFEAEDDRAGTLIAEILCEACSDIADGFELWQGVRKVVTACGRTPATSESASQISARMQESVIQREEMIRDSMWMIARSKRLIERMQRLVDEARRESH